MRVVYEKSIYKKLEDAINLARAGNKAIEEIILTKKEMDDLVRYMQSAVLAWWHREPLSQCHVYRICGVKIREE